MLQRAVRSRPHPWGAARRQPDALPCPRHSSSPWMVRHSILSSHQLGSSLDEKAFDAPGRPEHRPVL